MGLVVGPVEDEVILQHTEQVSPLEHGLAEAFQAVVFARHLPSVEGFQAVVPGGGVVQPQIAGGEELDELEQAGDVLGVEPLHLIVGLDFGFFDGRAFVFDDDQGQAVDIQHQIEAARGMVLKGEFLGEVEPVGGQIFVVDQGQVALLFGLGVDGRPVTAQGAEHRFIPGDGGLHQA